MAEPIPVCPTCYSISSPNLKKPADVALYLITWLFNNPGHVSSLNRTDMISFRYLEARYGKQPDVLAHEIETRLTDALARYFPNANYSALVTVEKKDGFADDGTYQGNYGLNIAMVDSNQAALIPRQQIKIGPDGASFTPTFTAK